MVHRRLGKVHPLGQLTEVQLGVCAAPPRHLAQGRRQCVELPCRFEPFDRCRLPQPGPDRLADVGRLEIEAAVHLAAHLPHPPHAFEPHPPPPAAHPPNPPHHPPPP